MSVLACETEGRERERERERESERESERERAGGRGEGGRERERETVFAFVEACVPSLVRASQNHETHNLNPTRLNFEVPIQTPLSLQKLVLKLQSLRP